MDVVSVRRWYPSVASAFSDVGRRGSLKEGNLSEAIETSFGGGEVAKMTCSWQHTSETRLKRPAGEKAVYTVDAGLSRSSIVTNFPT